MLKIKVLNHKIGTVEEKDLSLNQDTWLIGRAADCDLVLDGMDVSRIHGKIQFQQGYYYTDLGSANGSSINNQRLQVRQTYSLKVDDLIRIGDFALLVKAVSSASENPSIWQNLSSKPAHHTTWTGDRTVRCVRITDETPDIKTFTFVAEPPLLFDYKPGQFVTLELNIQGKPVSRSYSISSTPSRPHTLEITVKRLSALPDSEVPPGLVSNWLHDNLEVGSQVKLAAPLGKFTCFPDPASRLLMISAGSGITPLMSISRWLADTASSTDVVFFHCARTPRDLIFRQELEMMAARLANFRLVFSVTRSELGQPWLGFTGRLTESMLQQIAPDFQQRTVYVCGPDGFMRSTQALLEDRGFPMQNYYEESFGVPKAKKIAEAEPQSHLASPPIQPIVHFTKSAKEVAGAESILELAEQAGIKIRSNCRQGVCGACRKRKLAGEIKYELEPDVLDRAQQEAGYILTCVASAIGRVLVEA